MQLTDCEKCDLKQIPMNDTVQIDGITYCKSCVDSNFESREALKGRKVEIMHDPTVCSKCGSDFGEQTLSVTSGYPACDACTEAWKKKVQPAWVKLFFAAVLGIVVFSSVWNLRFFFAYHHFKKAVAAFSGNDIHSAEKSIRQASEEVPESGDLQTFATFYKGVSLLADDKSAGALVAFNSVKSKIPDDVNIEGYINVARMGYGFDTKDYDLFLNAAKDNLAIDSNAARSWISVASAYSCLYAAKGQDSDKVFAEKYIQHAATMDTTGSGLKTWAGLIAYRLETRDIIRYEDFIKKYPDGRSKN